MHNPDDLSSVSLNELVAAQNWQAQYRLILQWGKLIQPKPELRIAENVLKGCEVSAWLSHTEKNGAHSFAFDSDSRVINGLAILVLVHIDNKIKEEIFRIDFDGFLKEINFEKHLTPSRNNGLHSLIAKIKELIQ